MNNRPKALFPRIVYRVARADNPNAEAEAETLKDAVRYFDAGTKLIWAKYERGLEMEGVVTTKGTLKAPHERRR